MGRELKRVPLDFQCEGTWPGYQRACSNYDCDGCSDCARVEPPTGDGYQVWETVSEGSPISPVFADRADCVAWLMEHEACGPVAAEKFIGDGWAPSMIATTFGVFTGVQVAGGIPAHIGWIHEEAGDTTTLAPDTRIRHLESGTTGTVKHRFPPPDGEYYLVEWSRGLPSLLVEHPDEDPAAPMVAGCRVDGFEVIEPASAGGA